MVQEDSNAVDNIVGGDVGDVNNSIIGDVESDGVDDDILVGLSSNTASLSPR